MSGEELRPDSRLKNIDKTADASPERDSDKLVQVKKKDDAEDKDNEFLLHEKPSDEQMHESFDDLRDNPKDEEAD